MPELTTNVARGLAGRGRSIGSEGNHGLVPNFSFKLIVEIQTVGLAGETELGRYFPPSGSQMGSISHRLA